MEVKTDYNDKKRGLYDLKEVCQVQQNELAAM